MNRLISVAPMLACTDKHLRYFLRLFSKESLLFSEMVSTGAIIYGDRERFLSFNTIEHPLVLQLGGDNPGDLALCSKYIEEYGYDEVNLNVGCPSSRVQSGHFGACLMAEPELVANCVKAMQAAVDIPVSVKTRIGINELNSYQYISDFIEKMIEAGCSVFYIHARIALLGKYSPKENREKTPINYEAVYQLKQDFPESQFIVNGDIISLDAIEQHLDNCDGVMLGRYIYKNPYILAEIEKRFFPETYKHKSRSEVIREFLPYLEEQLSKGISLYGIARHLLSFFHGVKGAKLWRRHISENGTKKSAAVEIIEDALQFIEEE